MPIVVENLTYTYGKKSVFAKTALFNVSLKIEDGDFFGIIGHTGSGKSTLIKHFNGLIKLNKNGSIMVDDINLERFDYKKLRSKVGMVFQYPEYQLFEETVERDVAFAPKNMGITGEELALRVRQSIEAVGLSFDEVATKSPFELSGGQKRRVAIAGVIAARPSVLVLDEPTAGLDPVGRREILALLHSLKKTYCKTVVIISHNMDEIAENCTRVAVLNKGEVKHVLPPSKLFTLSEELASMGLALPTATKIGDALGISGVFTEDELVRQISQRLGGAK